jgi:GT2 family glycosyltransferase
MENYTIAICTLGENPNLKTCLDNLRAVRLAFQSKVDILIVINRIETDSEMDFLGDVKVVYEPQRGYSNARNAAVSNVPFNSNLIFIDDDELVSTSWFEALMMAHEKYPHDLLYGPVFSTSKSETTSYRNKFKSQFLETDDGAVSKQASTANLLIPSSILTSGAVTFDPAFNRSGSEDTDLCFRLRNLGYKIRFAKEAVLYEVEKEDRFDHAYLEKRFIRDVSNYSYIIRNNSGICQIARRFFTLSVRVLLHSVANIFTSTSKVKKIAYISSLNSLLKNQLRE